jgi:hypothetical protein
MLLLLAFALIRVERGIIRSVDELVHDLASHMSSSASIKSIVPQHFKIAYSQLVALRILGSGSSLSSVPAGPAAAAITSKQDAVLLCRSVESVRQFLQEVVDSATLWDLGGLTLQDRHLLVPLLRS